jgi:hypothetical protein
MLIFLCLNLRGVANYGGGGLRRLWLRAERLLKEEGD